MPAWKKIIAIWGCLEAIKVPSTTGLAGVPTSSSSLGIGSRFALPIVFVPVVHTPCPYRAHIEIDRRDCTRRRRPKSELMIDQSHEEQQRCEHRTQRYRPTPGHLELFIHDPGVSGLASLRTLLTEHFPP